MGAGNHQWSAKRTVWAPAITSNAAAPILGSGVTGSGIVAGLAPVLVTKFGYIAVGAIDPDAGGFVVDLVRRPIASSNANEVVIETLTRADADTIPAGEVVYKEVIIPVAAAAGDDTLGGDPFGQGSVVNVGPAGPMRVEPGQEAILEISNASGVAVNIVPFVEIVELGFEPFHASVTRDDT